MDQDPYRQKALARIKTLVQFHLRERKLGDHTMSGHAGQALRQAQAIADRLTKEKTHGPR
jgi:hypothetical protein